MMIELSFKSSTKISGSSSATESGENLHLFLQCGFQHCYCNDQGPCCLHARLIVADAIKQKIVYCKFGSFHEVFIFAKLRICEVS